MISQPEIPDFSTFGLASGAGAAAGEEQWRSAVKEASGSDVADLLRVARRILTTMLADRQGVLEQLREADAPAVAQRQT